MLPDDSQITLLLHRWTEGDAEALRQLLPVLYEPLRRLEIGRAHV